MQKKLPAWLRIAAAILAALVAAVAALSGALGSAPSDPGPARAPAHVAAPKTAPQLAGAEHANLAEPGETELGRLPLQAGPPDAIGGCTVRFNQHNFSSRGGSKITTLVAHYTVSRNVPGLADVNANANFLDTASTQASANFIIDDEGNCLYTVPIGLKAWTQAGANPFSVSIEFVALGTEGKLSAAALDRGGRVFAEVAKREHIPVQLGRVTNCQPVVPGEVDHAMLGACGGGHHDLRPMFGSSVVPRQSDDAKVLAPLIAATRAHTRRVTSVDRVTCRKLNAWRRAGRPKGGQWERNSVRRRRALESRGVRCTSSGPVLA